MPGNNLLFIRSFFANLDNVFEVIKFKIGFVLLVLKLSRKTPKDARLVQHHQFSPRQRELKF